MRENLTTPEGSEQIPETFFHEGIIVDKDGKVTLTSEAQEAFYQKYLELQNTLPKGEIDASLNQLTEGMVEAVEDVLISKSSSPLIQQSFFKRAWSLLNKSNQKKPNKRKRKEEKVDIVVKAQLRESFKELYLEYSMKKDGYRAMIPVPVIIRPGEVTIEDIIKSLEGRLTMHQTIASCKK